MKTKQLENKQYEQYFQSITNTMNSMSVIVNQIVDRVSSIEGEVFGGKLKDAVDQYAKGMMIPNEQAWNRLLLAHSIMHGFNMPNDYKKEAKDYKQKKKEVLSHYYYLEDRGLVTDTSLEWVSLLPRCGFINKGIAESFIKEQGWDYFFEHIQRQYTDFEIDKKKFDKRWYRSKDDICYVPVIVLGEEKNTFLFFE